MKKLILTLTGVMLISFGLAAFIFSIGGHPPEPVTGEVNVRKSFAMAGLQEIRVNTTWQEIRVTPVEGTQIRIHLHGSLQKGSPEDLLKAIITNGTLEISTRALLEPHWDLRLFGGVKTSNTTVLDLYLPKNYRQDLIFTTASGSVNIRDFQVNHWECRTSSGDIEAHSMTVHQAKLETSSGEIRTGSLNAPEISLNTHSGEVEGRNVTAKKVAVNTISGNVNFEALRGDLNLKTTSGSVECDEFEGNLEARTVSGDVNVHYLRFDHQINIGTISGEVVLELPQTTQFGLEFDSISGEYQSDFPLTLNGLSSKNKISGSVGGTQNRIYVHTTSGDFKLIQD